MLRLEMLPAACGDCLWLEYGDGKGDAAQLRVVIVDGGLRDTAQVLRKRIDAARRARNAAVLDVELLVVTHIDNDHILGVIELLRETGAGLRVKDIWFNGKPQLMRLPPPAKTKGAKGSNDAGRPGDMMGGDPGDTIALSSAPADLLGPKEGDELSALLAKTGATWNGHALWNGAAVKVPDEGALPVAQFDGGLTLTVLGPTLPRLYKLCEKWSDVLSGKDERGAAQAPSDLLGRRDTWPPVWKDGEKGDGSAANGSSIALLAEFGPHALLLAGDAHAPDLAAAVGRVAAARSSKPGTPLPLSAFKLAHHGSENNLTRALLEAIDCSRFMISTDGSVHRHPDHQALLRILRYARHKPELLFNFDRDTTRPWRDKKADVAGRFRDYTTDFPRDPAAGYVLTLN